MKFVYFGYDFMLGSVQRLLEEGHELIGIFTFECDNLFNFNRNTYDLAKSLNIPITEDRATPDDIDSFIESGCDIFLAAGYPHKIPPANSDGAYSINVHPALLPKGRGLMPSPYIITDHPEAAGITIHKLEEEFDAGDILAQQAFQIGPAETVETLSARGAMAAPDMLIDVFENIEERWNDAKPQNTDDVTYFPPPSDEMRMLNWADGINAIDKTARAFGRYGSIAKINDQVFVVYDHDVWTEDHGLETGQIACQMSREIVVTATDGYVCLKEFQIIKV